MTADSELTAPNLTDTLTDTDQEEAVLEHVMAAARPGPDGSWRLLILSGNRVRTTTVTDGRRAYRMLQETLAYVRTQHWDKKRRRWEPTLLPAPKGRKPLGPELRFDVLARDGHACRYCGRTAPDVPLHVDHIIPRSKGGTDDPSNLVTACQDCNLGKSDRVLV